VNTDQLRHPQVTTDRGFTYSFASDLSSKEGIEKLAEYIIQQEEYLDILISNAGIRRDPPKRVHVPTASLDELQASLWSSDHSDWDDTFRINCTAHYFLSVALLKLLVTAAHRKLPDGRLGRETGRGVIVMTSSCASLHNSSNIDLTSYATSKAGLDHLVALMATKFAPWYVRVNSINPGFVPSRMNPVEEGNNQFAELFAKMPATRMGRMEDIAGTVLWLCSKAGSYVDGRSICVDGGRVLLANGQ
jgi:NAD(P)-dependent dehydrogenase (short-subunit alcohol dehydrogenase family)